MGNVCVTENVADFERARTNILNNMATGKGEIEDIPEEALAAFRAQCQTHLGKPADFFGKQGEKVTDLWIVQHKNKSIANGSWLRTWQEKEKLFLFRNPATGAPLVKGLGLHPLEDSDYSTWFDYVPVDIVPVVGDLDAGSATYLFTTFLTKDLGPQGHEDNEGAVAQRFPLSAWASLDPKVKEGLKKSIKHRSDIWQDISNRQSYEHIRFKAEHVSHRSEKEYVLRARALGTQFDQHQAEWGYAHWGARVLCWTEETEDEVEDPATSEKVRSNGKVWIGFVLPAPMNKVITGIKFRYHRLWQREHDRYGPPQLENAFCVEKGASNGFVERIDAKLLPVLQKQLDTYDPDEDEEEEKAEE